MGTTAVTAQGAIFRNAAQGHFEKGFPQGTEPALANGSCAGLETGAALRYTQHTDPIQRSRE